MQSRQEVADAWDAVRVCMVGDGLAAGTRPSEQRRLALHAVVHEQSDAPWPARCLPYAERLDRALEARSIPAAWRTLPRAVAVVSSNAEDLPALDELHAALEGADLPLPQRDASTARAPAAVAPQFKSRDLATIGQVTHLDDVHVQLDEGRVLRLLLPEAKPLVCRFNDGPREQRWRSVACSSVPLTLGERTQLRLSPAMAGASDLIYARDGADSDGFYDGSTGQRIWRPRYFDAQAYVRDSGTTTILYAEMRDDHERERVEQYRALSLVPGQRPRNRRLPIASDARVMLLGDNVLWWSPTTDRDDALTVAALGDDKRPLGKPQAIGTLSRDARLVSSCESEGTSALFFVSGVQERRYALVFRKAGVWLPPLDVGVIEGKLTLSCHDGVAMLLRSDEDSIARWRCNATGCAQALATPPAVVPDTRFSVAPIGDSLALAWSAPGEPLRLRIAAPHELETARDAILVDDAAHSGLEPTSMRMISGDGLLLLLLQDEGGRIRALRIAATEASVVRIIR
jgi:hypothetical protein